MKKKQMIAIWAVGGTTVLLVVFFVLFLRYSLFKFNSNKMEISTKGKDFIKAREALKLTAYKAVSTETYYTIGYGHYGSDIQAGQTITKSEADELFDTDILKYEKPVKDMNVKITQNQFDALVSFCYNVGVSAFKGSTLYKKVVANPNDQSIKDEFLKWTKSNGQYLAGLETRRQKESDLYFG
jgi:GH24 family phage-related lysozyme (muramidase)